MSGETEQSISGWTTDTLHTHLSQKIDAVDHSCAKHLRTEMRRLHQQWQAQERALGAAMTAHEKAIDKAFTAQSTAMNTAMTAAEKALEQRTLNLDTEFHEHLVQYRHEVTLAFEASDRAVRAAFEASDKAISKAEMSNEKRFEAMNEFRGQLADQASTFIPRSEFTQQIASLTARTTADAGRLEQLITANSERHADRVTELKERLDLNQGRSSAWGIVPVAIGALLGLIGIISFFNAGQ